MNFKRSIMTVSMLIVVILVGGCLSPISNTSTYVYKGNESTDEIPAEKCNDVQDEDPEVEVIEDYISPQKEEPSLYAEICSSSTEELLHVYDLPPTPWFSPGRFRVIKINGHADVRVYLNNQLVAAIIDDIPQRVTSIIAGIDEDDGKFVYLPATEEYNTVLIATGDGTITFSVHEHNRHVVGRINRIVNYFDIPITNGQRLDAVIPAFSAEDLADITGSVSSTVYTLTTGETIILPDEDLTGYQATNANYRVNATSADRSQGIVFGSGRRFRGTYAIVIAISFDGYELLGWYVDNEVVVSSEVEYRFRVMYDVNLTARFAAVTPPASNYD